MHAIQLSPFNSRAIIEPFLTIGEIPYRQTKKRRVEEVTMYRCPECYELHEWESDAEKCCDKTVAANGDKIECPVCHERHESHRDAADCCLWKDIDAPTRWRIADAVENGSTWVEQLNINF